MKTFKNLFLGIFFIAVGIIFALNTIGITDIDIFFDGWWSLFIIVPSFLSLIADRDKSGAIIGLVLGVSLLLAAQNVIEYSSIIKLILPLILVIIGIKLILSTVFKKAGKNNNFIQQTLAGKEYSAVFSGHELKFDNEIFEGATLNAVFGGIDCDIRNAIIENDVFIKASAVFGGIDIILPDNVNVKTKTSALFGGVSEKKKRQCIEGAKTVYINADTIFGGIDIK